MEPNIGKISFDGEFIIKCTEQQQDLIGWLIKNRPEDYREYLNLFILEKSYSHAERVAKKEGISFPPIDVEYEEAIRLYDEDIALSPHLAKALLSKGKMLMDLSYYDEAIKYFDKVLNIYSRNFEASFYKGKILKYLGKNSEANLSLIGALDAKPNDVKALTLRGEALKDVGEVEWAIELYDQALKIDPEHVDAIIAKSTALKILGKYEEAKILREKAIEYFRSRRRPKHLFII